jgi:hypothetical protein
MSPNGRFMPEPPGIMPIYAASLLLVLLTCWVMRKTKSRWPQLGTFGLIMVAFGFRLVASCIEEIGIMAMGAYTYAGSIRSLSLFAGHYYQYPIYEAVLWAALVATWAAVRYFKNDRGETVVEHGIDEIRASQKQKTGIRYLALVGILGTTMLAFNVAWMPFALNQDPWPRDITSRSYLVDGFCGSGTNYACPGPKVPIPVRKSAHLDPNGNLVPAG